jgi:energy-converting hydrogenase Eha subunit H
MTENLFITGITIVIFFNVIMFVCLFYYIEKQRKYVEFYIERLSKQVEELKKQIDLIHRILK